jgi:sec-independent protein translocase protein TatC
MADGDPGYYSESSFDETAGQTPVATAGPAEDEEMPLTQHVEEMVRRLGVVFLVTALVSGIVFPFADQIVNFLWYSYLPTTEAARPRVYHPLALMFARLKVATLMGFIGALPVLVYQSYRFMKPGLYPRERRYYLAAVPTSLILAGIGLAFSYAFVLPVLFDYFMTYSESAANIAFGLTETFNLIVMLMGFFALTFQIPLLIMLAIMMGITSRIWLASRRMYFWGGFLGVAFIFNPDPTGVAPFLIAGTMIALFEGTLLLLRWTQVGSPLPTLEAATNARPYVWGLALVAGYVVSSAPLPANYYGQLPPVLVDALNARGLDWAAPALIGGGTIVLYEVLRALLARLEASLGRALGHIRAPVWIAAIAVGYFASPNPPLLALAKSTAFPRQTALLVAVAIIVVYEALLAGWRWRRNKA